MKTDITLDAHVTETEAYPRETLKTFDYEYGMFFEHFNQTLYDQAREVAKKQNRIPGRYWIVVNNDASREIGVNMYQLPLWVD